MGNPAKTCRWILANGEYCNQPVKWVMKEDGGEPGAALVREYRSFCPKHQAIADTEE